MIRIAGIDPGLSTTGWGVVSVSGTKLDFIACGIEKTNSTAALSARLAFLHTRLLAMLRLYQPDSVAVEETFVNKDARSALKLGHARGIALMTPALLDIPVSEYAPNQIKKTVVGVGHADKNQVMHMVRRLLPGAQPQNTDAADALATAICHALIAPAQARLKAAAQAL